MKRLWKAIKFGMAALDIIEAFAPDKDGVIRMAQRESNDAMRRMGCLFEKEIEIGE